MVSKTDPDTVVIHEIVEGEEQKAVADGTITPGDAIEHSGTETTGELQVTRLNTDDAVDPLVAEESADAGRGITDDYSDGDAAVVRRPIPGERYFMRLVSGTDASTSSDANVSVGDVLAPSGTAGTLEAAGTNSNGSFQAIEAVDNSGASSGTHARIRVEAI